MNSISPRPFNPNQKRFCPSKPFPEYRHIPGNTPHPISDPMGHSYNKKIVSDSFFSINDWKSSEIYLYGIDLFNYAYWWESHEYLEEVWRILGKDTLEKLLVQAVIQLAAGLIKCFQANFRGMTKLFSKSQEKIEHILSQMGDNSQYLLGINLEDLATQIKNFQMKKGTWQIIIDLKLK